MSRLLNTGWQRSGKNSRIVINGSTLAMARWNVQMRGDDLPTENFESGGLNEGILGFIGMEYSIAGDWDANLLPFDTASPPGLYPRDDMGPMSIYENVADGTSYDFLYARVRSATNGAEAKGKVSFDASGMSNGDVTLPGGTTLSAIQTLATA